MSLLDDLISQLTLKARTPDLDGYKPEPQQITFHKSKARGRIVLGGNRSGKSYASVVEMLNYATGQKENFPAPLHLRHVAVDRPNGIDKILKDLYKKLTPRRFLINGSFEESWKKEPPSLNLTNGSIIEFMSYEQDLDKHSGTSRHAIAFDEEPDKAIFEENLIRLIDTNGHWWIAMTPVEGMSWVYFDYVEPLQENTLNANVELFIFNTLDNSHLNIEAISELTQNLSEQDKEVRLRGKFISLSGLIYPFDKERHVKELLFQEGLLTFAAMDHGLRNPTGWLWIQVDSDGNYFVVDEIYKKGMLVKDIAQLVNLKNLIYSPLYSVGDPSIVNRNPINGQSVQTEYANHDIFIALGNNDVDVGLGRVSELLNPNTQEEPRLYISSRCENLIKELRRYRWSEWSSKKMQTKKEDKPSPLKKDDHLVDALRYAIMSRPYHDTGTELINPLNKRYPIDQYSVAVPREDYSYATFVRTPNESYDYELGSEF